MADFNVRSDQVNVEQIMEQIRARIREKRGVDYTEAQIRELAAVKLEKFLDPRGLRSDLLEEFRRTQASTAPPAPPNYAFGEDTLFETHRGPLQFIRRLLQPILKLFFNPNPLVQALHIQSEVNTINADRETKRRGLDQLHFEVLHNLVIETTRMGIEIKNLKMRVESLTGRLEFDERRSRALESVVAYQPSAGVPPSSPHAETATERRPLVPEPLAAPAPAVPAEGPGQRSRRRRRRRGRRSGGSATSIMGAPGSPEQGSSFESSGDEPDDDNASPNAGGAEAEDAGGASIQDALSGSHRIEPVDASHPARPSSAADTPSTPGIHAGPSAPSAPSAPIGPPAPSAPPGSPSEAPGRSDAPDQSTNSGSSPRTDDIDQ